MSDLPKPASWPIYESMPVPCLVIMPDLLIGAVNDAYLTHTNLERQDLLQHSFFEIVQADNATEQQLRTSFTEVLETKKSAELQLHYTIAVAGKEITDCWNIKNVPVPEQEGYPSYILHFATPVGDFKKRNTMAAGSGNDFDVLVNKIKNHAIFLLDENGIIRSWNKGAENIKGYEAAEVIGQSMNIFYQQNEVEQGIPQKNLALALDNGGMETKGWRLRKDGSSFYANITFTPLKNDEGIHSGFLKVTRDITEETAHIERMNFLADITRNIEDPIVTTDPELNITRWNRAAERLFGWTAAEALGRNTVEVLRAQFPEEKRAAILKSLDINGYWQGEVVYLSKSGNQLTTLCTVSHLKDINENITGNLVLIKDFTARKQAEQQLAELNADLERRVEERTREVRNTEKKYQYLFENNPMPMWVIKQDDFSFMAVNNMAVLQYGYSREEFLSMTAKDIRPDEEKELFVNADHSFATTAENFNKGNWKHKKKDGTLIDVQVMAHGIMFENSPAKMILANDITDKKRAEEKVAASEKQLRNTLNNMMEGVQIHDFDWRYIFVNETLTKFSQSPREELIGTRLMDKYPGIEQTDAFKSMERVMKSRIGEQIETAFVFPDGRKAHYQLSIQPVPEGIFVRSIDITERRIAEEEYAKSQENYRTIMERISDAFVALDSNWNYQYINKAAGIILGRSPEELIGKNIWNEFPESTGYRLYEAFHEAFNTQRHIYLEEFYVPFDMWMELSIYPSPDGLAVFFANINKRKLAELKLVESEANLKAIFDNTSEGFILTDTEGNVKLFNDRVTEVVLQNVSHQVRTGVNIFQLTESERLEFFRQVFNQVLKGETIQYDRQYPVKDGNVLWINLCFNPVREKDKVVGVCITIRDITDRRRAEDQLQKSYFEKRALAEKLSAILNTLPANIALVDQSGRIIEVNDSWRNFAIQNDFKGNHFGLGENYLTVAATATGADQQDGLNVARGLSRVLRDEMQEFIYEYPCDAPAIDRWYRMVATPLHQKAYAGAVVMHLDISELRRLEAERMQLQLDEQKKITQAILQGQEKERNYIGREMHDNINQILAGVRIYLFVAGNHDTKVKEAIQYPIELLDQSIEEIRKLCSSMVTPLQDVQLQELISDLLRKLKANNIETVFDYSVPGDPLSDELKLNLYRIVQELSNNIVKYAGASVVKIKIWIENNKLRLLLTDNGKGFDPSSKKEGIGISNMRSRVQSFNGEIKIESSVGNGTSTRISIPCNSPAAVQSKKNN